MRLSKVCYLCKRPMSNEDVNETRAGFVCTLRQECDWQRQRNIWNEQPMLAPEGYHSEEMRRRPSSTW